MSLTQRQKNAIIAGIVLLFIGFIFLALGESIQLPSEYKTFLGIPYAVNSAYATDIVLKTLLMVMSYVMIIFGALTSVIGLVIGNYTPYRASNPNNQQIPSFRFFAQPQAQAQQRKIYCFSCGAENLYEAAFCNKCGQKLAKSTN